MVRVRVQVAVAAASLVMVLLAGCSEDEPAPKMPDPPSPSASESPVASESPSVAPDQESPEEFVRRWQAAGDEMQVTGETDAYRRLGPKCQPCAGFADAVEEIYADGGRIEFEGTDVLETRRAEQAEHGRIMEVEVRLRVPRTVIRRPTGKPETMPAGQMTLGVTLQRRAKKWQVTHFGILR